MQELQAKTTLQSALGDTAGLIYGKQDIEDALRRSLIAYSTYFPAKRNMGQGSLVYSVAAGATEITVIGTLPAVGQQYTVGYGSSVNETITIASFVPTPFSTYQMTLESGLVNNYYAGMLVSPPLSTSATTPVLGLQITQGYDTFSLPIDFIAPDAESFSIAIGDRASYKVQNSYYDQSQVIFNELNSTGYGRGQGWSTYSGAGYPIYGNPFAQPSVSGLNVPELVFEFLEGDFPYLSLNVPAPFTKLLTFKYNGIQSWPGIKNQDMEIISLYAQYAALEARASNYAYGGDVEVEDYKETNSNIVKQLLAQAKDALKRWNSFVQRPYITAG